MSELDPYVKFYLEQQLILIVDPSASFGQSLVGTLNELGAPTSKILYAKRYEEALRIIHEYQPKILITEYFVGEKFGLNLVQEQLKFAGEANRISILITHNSAASAIAEAAEEQVDDYILKPFSMGQMKDRLVQVIKRKTNPTPYALKIREGKKHLIEKQYDLAELLFNSAKDMNNKPTLAHYYIGYTKFLQKNFLNALDEFKIGRQLQPMHYKCLIGEFDSFFEQKKYIEANQLTDIIIRNYPVSPRRLGTMIIAAVFSNHFDLIPKFYETFKLLDHKTPELIKIFSAALMTAGKFQIKNKNLEIANSYFEMGVNIIGPDIQYLDQVIRELLKLKATDLASVFLSKFPGNEFGQTTYTRLSFLIDRYILPRHQVIEKGKKLVAQGLACQESFETLIDLILEEEKPVLAEDIAAKAVLTYPSLRSKIYKKIDDCKLALESKQKAQVG